MKNNRKGFTITELVIVIAVIAILAAVLIPTFTSIIKKANDSAALQEARAIYTEYTAQHDYTSGSPAQNLVIKVDDTTYLAVKGAQMQDDIYENANEAAEDGADITAVDGVDNDYVLVSKNADGTLSIVDTELDD